MVMVCEDQIFTNQKGQKVNGFALDGYIKKNLDFEVKRLKKNWDCIMLMDGQEGAAKTTFGSAVAYYMSSELGTKFDLTDMIYTIDQFNDWVDTQPPGSVCVWDEFVMAGLSTEALSRIQNALVKKMTIMRQKRLVIILIVPYIFLLRKYFAIARTRCLINIYTPNNMDRGYFKYFSYPNKRMLYMKGVKYWEYNTWRPDFFGNFTNTTGYFYDMEEYNYKKNKAMESLKDIGEGKDTSLWKPRVMKAISALKDKGAQWEEIGQTFDMKKATICDAYNVYLKNNPDFLGK